MNKDRVFVFLPWSKRPQTHCGQDFLPVAARESAEGSVIPGHLQEARTYLPQRVLEKMQMPRIWGRTPTGKGNPGHLGILKVKESL